MTRILPLTLLLAAPLCSACGESAGGDGVGGVSASEAQALNDAAAMLDQRAAPPEAGGDRIQGGGPNPAAMRAAKKDGQ